MANHTTTPDVAIVGGGPSGLAFAALLEQASISYIVFEKYGRNVEPLGGCLDLHRGSGQEAFEQAGCHSELKRYGRLGAATIHRVFTHDGHEVFAWGQDRDAPELDRFDIRRALLTTIPDQNVRWGTTIVEATRDDDADGRIVLHLSDGTTATGFKLVVGADGTWSKVRGLVTPSKPKYSGYFNIYGYITPQNAYYSKLCALAKEGPMIVMGKRTKIWIQQQGSGRYHCDAGFIAPADFAQSGTIDLRDTEAVKRLLLTDDFFGRHCSDFKDTIASMEGPLRQLPMYYTDPETLNWSASPDVTLIGDAAHTTLPFVGEGANQAMLDAVVLAKHLKELGIGREAIAQYESTMQPVAKDMIERSNKSGELFFDTGAPATFMDYMKKTPLIKNMA